MSFMQPQVTERQRWVETEEGYVPEEYWHESTHGPEVDQEGGFRVVGFGARLSAPGYMDCTDWIVEDTAQKAWEALVEMYPESFALECEEREGEEGEESYTLHRYCSCEEEAYALVWALRTTCGASWERDGTFVYCCVVGVPFKEILDDLGGCDVNLH